jgi:hypothetical protein
LGPSEYGVFHSALAQGTSPVDDRNVTITPSNVLQTRATLTRKIWGDSGYPTGEQPARVDHLTATEPEQVALPTPSELTNLERIDRIVISVSGDNATLESRAYHFIPQNKNHRVVIVHQGHSCRLDDRDLSSGIKATITRLLREGYSVVGMRMPGYQDPSDCPFGNTEHYPLWDDAKYRMRTGSLLKFFAHPLAIVLNYLRSNFPEYVDYNLVGLSGGGWTTTVYAAVDPTIHLSFPIAGTLPIYMKREGYLGNPEQHWNEYFRIAGYPDQYVLGGFGRDRQQIQIMNKGDVYVGQVATKYDWGLEVMAYEVQVQKALARLDSGSFKVFIEPTFSGHMISANALDCIVSTLNATAPGTGVGPALATLGISPSGALATIQAAGQGDWFKGSRYSWNLNVHDIVVPGMISDFDGDKFDDFVSTSGWGIGVIGNDANDNLVSKALTPYGTDIGIGWILSPDDEVVAVGRFAGPERPAQLVLKRKNAPNDPGAPLFAFVAAEEGNLRAKTVVAIGDWIIAQGVGWLVSRDDKVIGAGQLNGKTDGLVVTSGWGMGIWVPKWSGKPDLLFIAPNETEFRDPEGLHSGTWKLVTTDPSFRLLGISDIDNDQKAEMILANSSGFAVLNKYGSDVWGSTALALRFDLDKEEDFPGTTIASTDVAPPFPLGCTKDRLVSMMDFDKSDGADLLFQGVRHEVGGIQNAGGITVLRKSAAPEWSFEVIATRDYPSGIGEWAFSQGDLLPPLAGDFNGDGQNDFPITSGWGLGVLTISGSDFREIALAPYEALPISSSAPLVGVGKFDHSGRARLLVKNAPPARP